MWLIDPDQNGHIWLPAVQMKQSMAAAHQAQEQQQRSMELAAQQQHQHHQSMAAAYAQSAGQPGASRDAFPGRPGPGAARMAPGLGPSAQPAQTPMAACSCSRCLGRCIFLTASCDAHAAWCPVSMPALHVTACRGRTACDAYSGGLCPGEHSHLHATACRGAQRGSCGTSCCPMLPTVQVL